MNARKASQLDYNVVPYHSSFLRFLRPFGSGPRNNAQHSILAVVVDAVFVVVVAAVAVVAETTVVVNSSCEPGTTQQSTKPTVISNRRTTVFPFWSGGIVLARGYDTRATYYVLYM